MYDVCVSLRQTSEFSRIKPGIHTGKHREAASGWKREIGFVAERCAVLPISV
jgi:hypothetical protein